MEHKIAGSGYHKVDDRTLDTQYDGSSRRYSDDTTMTHPLDTNTVLNTRSSPENLCRLAGDGHINYIYK